MMAIFLVGSYLVYLTGLRDDPPWDWLHWLLDRLGS